MRSSSSGALSRPGGRWASAEATISLPTRAGAPSATAYATRPPRLKPNRSASAIHRRSEEHTSELQSLRHLVCRLLLEKKKKKIKKNKKKEQTTKQKQIKIYRQ